MTEQQKLEYILSMRNETGKPLAQATKDLKEYLKTLIATQRMMSVVLTGKSDQGPQGHQGAYRRNASKDAKDQLKAAKDILAEKERAEKAAASADEARQKARARLIVGNYRQEKREQAEAARAKAAADREEEARARYRARLIMGNYKQEQKELREFQKLHAQMSAQVEKDERKAQQRAAQQRSARMQGVGNIISGGGQVISGVSGMAGNLLSFGRQLLTITGYAYQFGKAILGSVVNVLEDVEHKAKLATGALIAIGAVVANAGLKFNEFKEDTLTTLTVLTKSAKTAKDIFDYSFKLAIPASFPFRDILEAGRTLESFGLKFNAFNRESGEYIKASVMLAQGMQKPLAQVTRFMGNLSQGRLLLQQAAPLAMGRATLAKYGIEFDTHGSAKNRDKLAGAAMRAIQDEWGGILEEMKNNYSTMWDSMKSYSEYFFGEITQGMFKSFARAMGNVAELFKELINPTTAWAKSLKEALKVPFDLLGAMVENASKWLPQMAQWMSQIVTKENIINGLTEVISLFVVMYQDVKAFIEQNSGGNGLVGLWEAFKNVATGAMDSVLEVWTEFKTALEFISTHGDEIWAAITDGARSFVAILEVIAGLMVLNFGGQMLGNILNIGSGLGGIGKGISGLLGGKGAAPAGMTLGAFPPKSPFGFGPFDPSKFGGGMLHPEQNQQAYANDAAERQKDNRFSGGAGWLQELGRWAIGGALDMGKQSVPKSATDIWDKYQTLRQQNMGNFAADKARRHQAAGDISAQIRSMIGGVMETKAEKSNDMPPAHQMPGMGAPWEREDWATQFAQNSAAVNEAKIKAFEKGIGGYDQNDKAIARQQGMGLYQKHMRDSYEKVLSTGKEISNRYAEAKEGEAPQLKDENEKIKNLEDYWKAVEGFWDSQADIQKINREAQDAITNKFKEANEARTNMIESQISMLPESEQAAAKAQNLIPMLVEKQQILLNKLKTVQQGTKEYYDILGESWNAEKQINDLRNDAIDDQANQAFHRPTRQISTIKKLIGMMPKGARKGAMAAMIGPRIQQAYQAALMERDPEKREDKLLEVMDLFTAFKEDRKKNDPFGEMFGASKAAQRSQAIRDYQHGAFGGRAKRGRGRNQNDIFSAMSPFAPAPNAAGGGAFSSDRFTQLIFQLPVNATEEQMTAFVSQILNQQLTNTFGRQ